MNNNQSNQQPEQRPADEVDGVAIAGEVSGALWTDGRLVLKLPVARLKPDGTLDLTPEETLAIAKLTSSLIFI